MRLTRAVGQAAIPSNTIAGIGGVEYHAYMTSHSEMTGNASQTQAESCEDRCDVQVLHLDAVAVARAQIPGEDALSRAVEIAALLANPTRLRILAALAPTGPGPEPRLCVCDLAAVVGASETQTSHQLRALRLAGLVLQRREGRLVFYRLSNDSKVRAAVAALAGGR